MKTKINKVFRDTFISVSQFRKHKVKTTLLDQLKNWQEIDNISFGFNESKNDRLKRLQINTYINNYFNFQEIMETKENKIVTITQDNAKELRKNTKESMIANCQLIVGHSFDSYLLGLNWAKILATKKAEEIDANFIDETKDNQDFVVAYNANFKQAKKEQKEQQVSAKYVKKALDEQLFNLCNQSASIVKEVKSLAVKLNCESLFVARYVAVADAMNITLLEAVQKFAKIGNENNESNESNENNESNEKTNKKEAKKASKKEAKKASKKSTKKAKK